MGKRLRSKRSPALPWSIAGVAVLAILAIALTVAALRSGPAAPNVADFTPKPMPTQTQLPRAAFLGDSYIEGYGATANTIPAQVSKAMNWQMFAMGQSGTGYLADGGGGARAPYPGRSSGVPAKSSVVMISGGLNDVKLYPQNPGAFRAAVRETIGNAKTAAPDAKVVVVGIYWPYPDVTSDVEEMNTIILESARDLGAMTIDPLGESWMSTMAADGLLQDDKYHPNQAGYDYLATRLVSAIQALGI